MVLFLALIPNNQKKRKAYQAKEPKMDAKFQTTEFSTEISIFV
jgi:hypothetical protein